MPTPNPVLDPDLEELNQLCEHIGCLCGIPGCKGHEDKGGFIELDASKLRFRSTEPTEGSEYRAS
jgi:hypothetical protein